MDETKIKRLNTVFLKAIDCATDSVTPSDLKGCFSNDASCSTSTIENAFVNSVGKMKNSIETQFEALCSQDETFKILESANIRNKESTTESQSFIEEIQKHEESILQESIAQMQQNIDRLRKQIDEHNNMIFDKLLPEAHQHEQTISSMVASVNPFNTSSSEPNGNDMQIQS